VVKGLENEIKSLSEKCQSMEVELAEKDGLIKVDKNRID